MKIRFGMFSSSFTKDTVIYGSATLAERLVSFLLIPILTKTLPQELYGVWTQIVITTSLLSNIILTGFNTSLVRYIAGKNEKTEIKKFFYGMFFIVLMNSCISIIATLLFSKQISTIMFGGYTFYKFVPLFGFLLAEEALFELMIAFLRAQKKMYQLSFFYFLKSGGRMSIMAFAILVIDVNFIYAITFITIFQLLLIILIFFNHILRKIGFIITLRSLFRKDIILYSLPLLPYSLLIWFNNFIGRYFILHTVNINQLSIYAVSYSLAGIVGLFYSIMGFTLFPHMASLWNKGEKTGSAQLLAKSIEYYLFFAVPSIALITIFNEPIVQIFTTSQYLSNWRILFFLSVGIGLFGIYQFIIYPILLANKTLLNLEIAGIAVVLNVLLNVFLTPRLGILGTSITVFLSNGTLVLITVMTGKKHFSYIFPRLLVNKILPTASLIILYSVFMKKYVDINTLQSLLFIVAPAIVLYCTLDILGKNSLLIKLWKRI